MGSAEAEAAAAPSSATYRCCARLRARWARRRALADAVLLCLVGFLLNFKPSEPFLVPYLVQDKGFSEDVVDNSIFPVWTYAYLACLAAVGLVAEAWSYKPVIVLGACARVATRVLLLFGTSLLAMQAMQATFGLATAVDTVYASFVYLLVPAAWFQRVTSLSRAAVLLGHCGSALLGQALVSNAQPFSTLFFVSLGGVAVGSVLVLFLSNARKPVAERRGVKGFFAGVRAAFRERRVLLLSVWLWIAWSVHEMVLNYITNLFFFLAPSIDLNGYIVFGGRIWASCMALLPIAFERCRRAPVHDASIVAVSFLGAASLLICAFSLNLYVAYATYIAYFGFIEFGLAVVWSSIASSMPSSTYAAVYTIDTFIALVVQTAMQVALGHEGLHVSIANRFIVFAAWLGLLAVYSLVLVALLHRQRVAARRRTELHASSAQSPSPPSLFAPLLTPVPDAVERADDDGGGRVVDDDDDDNDGTAFAAVVSTGVRGESVPIAMHLLRPDPVAARSTSGTRALRAQSLTVQPP